MNGMSAKELAREVSRMAHDMSKCGKLTCEESAEFACMVFSHDYETCCYAHTVLVRVRDTGIMQR